ncbi:MAG: DUF4838 domain-containing protein [Lentisphaeria bacterium]|nr:DUF4838 domain-containing protein [Lentisphaeria bacterium]
MMKKILSTLLSFAFFISLYSAEILFWEKGKNFCEILLPAKPDPRENEAAELLKKSFPAMGSGKFSKSEGNKGVRIHIGNTPAGKKMIAAAGRIDPDGFVIDAPDSKNLVIAGGSPLGTLFGVMEFLERYAGVMWVWPGKYGTVIPRKESFSAVVKYQREEPAFRIRQLGVDPSMAHFFRFAIRNTDDERAQYSHNINKTMPPKLWEKHPEYFNMLNGVRRKPVKMKRQACTSNPAVIKIFIEGAARYFKRFPRRESFSVAQSDGGHFCECPQCRALDVPGVPGVTDRYFTFANQVADGIAKEFPEKFIASLAYGDGTQEPPSKISLRPNVIPCLVIPSMSHPRQSVEKWAAKASNLYAYFHLHGRENPKLYATVFAEYLRFLKKNKVVGICGELHPALPKLNGSYEIDGPRSWIISKLIWNPQQDPGELLKMFCDKFYGPAAKPMLRYYSILEKAWQKLDNVYDFRCDYDNSGFFLYTPGEMKEMVQCVREAEKLAGRDKEIKGRIAALKKLLFPRASYYCFAGLKKDPSPEKVIRAIEEAKKLNPVNPMLYLPAEEAEAVDLAFRKLPAGKFSALMKKTPELDFFDHSGAKYKNFCSNPGFEKQGRSRKVAGADWQKINAAGWSSWIGVYTPGSVTISPAAARSGKRGVLFDGCQAATVNYVIPVSPGERYRVTAWFKGKGGHISANFKDKAKKWLHKSSFIKSRIANGNGEFEKITMTFSVPLKAASCSLLFGVRDQKKGEKMYLDDVEIIRLGNSVSESK